MKQDEFIPAFFEEAQYLSPAVQEAQRKAELKNAAIRHAERMAAYRAWVDPSAIAERKERHEREAAASLLATRAALGIAGEEEPIPDNLPAYMRGQSPSTIRAMLRQERQEKMAPPPITWKSIDQIMAEPKARTWWQKLWDWLF